jgi:hypothetical protein
MTGPTKALYVDWSIPRKRRGVVSHVKKPWEIALIISSTHFSKKVNNLSPILCCDQEIYEYYKSIGLDKCFDEIRPVLPSSPNFDPSVFWSAGKFFAILNMEESFIMIDLDAEIRFKLDLSDCDVFCTHLERVNQNDLFYYPDPIYLGPNSLVDKYGTSWGDTACNTCFLYFKDISIAKEYATEALEFIHSIPQIKPGFEMGYILFAEQRYLYRMIMERGLKMKTLLSGYYITEDPVKKIPSYFEDSNIEEISERGFLHVWGFKTTLSKNPDEEHILFGDLISRRPDLVETIVECVSKNTEIINTVNI